MIFHSIQLITDFSCKFEEFFFYFDACVPNLIQLGSTNPKKNSQTLDVFFGGGLVTHQRKTDFFLNYFFVQNFQFFFQKFSNLLERSGIGWIERKTKFQIFPIFIFRVMKKKHNVAGNSGLPLSANLLKLESSILPRAKRASSETT